MIVQKQRSSTYLLTTKWPHLINYAATLATFTDIGSQNQTHPLLVRLASFIWSPNTAKDFGQE